MPVWIDFKIVLPDFPVTTSRGIALIADEAAPREDNLIYAGIVAEEVARGDFNCVLPSLAPLVLVLSRFANR